MSHDLRGLLVAVLLLPAGAQAAEHVVNGDFRAGPQGWNNWTATGQAFRNFESSSVPSGGTAPCFQIAPPPGTGFVGGIYQALSLVPGQDYIVSGRSRDLQSQQNASAHVLIGTAKPADGQDYFDNGTVQNPPGTLHLFGWSAVQCAGWNGDQTTACVAPLRFRFRATAATMYLVVRCGQANFNISFDDLSIRDADECTPPKIEKHPEDRQACIGATVTFSVGGTGTAPISFQWQRNGKDLENGPHYLGVNSSQLTVRDIDGTVVGSYTCRVSNACGFAMSEEARLTTAVLYVDAQAEGRSDGSSWTDAFQDLQAAIFAARAHPCGGAEIWVANGFYASRFNPNPRDPRGATFLLANQVAIFGGFEGASKPVNFPDGEIERDQRRPRDPANATVLTSDPVLGRYVITSAGNDASAVVDGFIIQAPPGQPTGCGGEFSFNKSLATIRNNEIRTSPARYLALAPEPEFQQPNLGGNILVLDDYPPRAGSQGTLLELRQNDFQCPEGCPQEPGGLIQLDQSPGYQSPWTIDTLDVQPGRRVTLTNRKGMQFESAHETAYVRNLILRENAFLNTAGQRLYYRNALIHPTARVINVPLRGLSLQRLSMDDPFEFECLARRDDDVSVEAAQVTDGVLRLKRSGSGPVALTVRFDGAGEDFLGVGFDYRFFGSPTELIVSLRESAESDANEVLLARIRPPRPGRPGAANHSRFGAFQGRFPRSQLNLHRETFIRLELRELDGKPADSGPVAQPQDGEESGVDIDNWGARIVCSYGCADLSGNGVPDDRDYLLVLSLYGRDTTQVDLETGDCSDAIFGGDQYIDLSDLLAWDVILDPSGALPDACGLLGGSTLALSGSGSTAVPRAASTASRVPLAGAVSGPAASPQEDGAGYMVIAGKSSANPWQEDALYTVDMSGACAGSSPGTPAGGEASRSNGRLVRDRHGQVYQVHGISYGGSPDTQGLIRLSDAASLVPPRTGLAGPPGVPDVLVSIGLTEVASQLVGLPFADAAFHPSDDDVVYVTPVLVAPTGGSCPYKAAARLRLQPGEPPYQIEALYGVNPAPTSSITAGDCLSTIVYEPDTQQLRELEVDIHEMLYVTNAQAVGDNDFVLVYNGSSGLSGELEPILVYPLDETLSAPAALTWSAVWDQLFLASSTAPLPQAKTRIYRFSIQRSGGMVTGLSAHGTLDITNPLIGDVGYGLVASVSSMNEAPDGSLCVIGLTTPKVPADLSTSDPLYAAVFGPYPAPLNPVFSTPTFAIVPASFTGPVNSVAISCFDLSLPVSSVLLDTTAPVISSAVARRSHGSAGAFDIHLSLAAPVSTECRAGGPTQLILTFSEPVRANDGTLDDTEIALTSGTLAHVSLSGRTMTLDVAGVADETCLTVSLSGLADLAGNNLAPGTSVRVRVLQADVDEDGTVTAADVAAIKGSSGAAVSALNFRSDLTVDGEIDCGDVIRAKARLSQSASCP